ncbi:MAG: hypothetical protein HY438_02450 [DPANN group archaeon]|nr:hypothetical protein [DPANN group archaeon]
MQTTKTRLNNENTEKKIIRYDFKSREFDPLTCIILDTVVSNDMLNVILRSNLSNILSASSNTTPERKRQIIRQSMILDFINRANMLDSKTTLDDYVDYASAVICVDGLPASKSAFDVKNKTTKSIIDAVLQLVTGSKKSIISKIKSPDDAEAAAFIGAYIDAKRGAFEFKKDIRTTAELLARENSIANVPEILLKFDDRKTALKYFEKNKDKLSAEDYSVKSRLHGLEKDVEGEIFSLLEASKLNVDYVSGLSKLLASQTLNSSLLDKLDSALDEVKDPELLYKLEPQDTKRAIRLLERAVRLKEDEKYYMRLGELYVNASNSIKAGFSFANAVRLNPNLLSDAMEEVQSAKIQSEFVAGLADAGLNISAIVSACSEQEQVEIFSSYLNNNIIFSYFVNDTKNFKDILPQVEKKLSVQLSAEQYETLADRARSGLLVGKALSLNLDDIADRFYDKAIASSPSVKAYVAKHDINIKRNNALEAFKCLANAIKISSLDKPAEAGFGYVSLLAQGIEEIVLSGRQAAYADILLDNLSTNSSARYCNLAAYNLLANIIESEDTIIKCYEHINSRTFDSDLKNWARMNLPITYLKEKFKISIRNIISGALLAAAGIMDGSIDYAYDEKNLLIAAGYLEKGKNFDGAIRFLDEALKHNKLFHDARIKKENILFEQGKKFESLELIINGLGALKPEDEKNAEHSAKYTKIICERLEQGAYTKRELGFLADVIRPFFDNSATQVIESAKICSRRGDRDYAEFISKVYSLIIPSCPPDTHAAFCADKAEVEFGFDAKKSLESFVEAVKYNYNYFDSLLKKGYGLQAIREVLPGIIKNMPPYVTVNTSREFAALGGKFKEEAGRAVENSIQWQNNLKSAIMCFEEAKAHWPNAETYNAIGELYKLMLDNNNALSAFINAAEISKNCSTLERFCDNLFVGHYYDSAFKGYDFILSRMSSEPVLIAAGRCKVELKDNVRAIEYFDGVLQIENSGPAMRSEAFFWKSVALENSGNTRGALDVINSAFSAGVNSGDRFYSRKLDLELKLGKTEDIITTLNSVTAGELKRQYKSRVAIMLAQKGYEKLATDDSGAALNLASKSLEIENNWLAYYVKGLNEERNLAFVSAAQSYKQAMSLTPQRMDRIMADALERCALKAYEYDSINVISAGHIAAQTDWLVELYTDKHGKSATRLGAIDTVLSFSLS